MADEVQYSSRPDHKRKFDDPATTPPASAPRRPSGFSSAPISAASPENHGAAGGAPPPASYNSVPPPVDGIELAKQRAQEIAAKLFNDAEAKRPKIENGAGNDSYNDYMQKPLGQQVPSYAGITSAASFNSYGTYAEARKKIDVPNGRVGVIIGKGGETIKYLQTQSGGCKIQVTRDADADPYSQTRTVELSGTSEQISKAEKLISDVLSEAEAGGSGVVTARKFVGGQVGGEQFSMKVPNNKVGLIIGKGGETIKNMQASSGARIQIIPLHPPPGDTSTERTVQIDGTQEQIESAKQLVNEVISENRRNPQMGGYSQQGYRPPRPPTNWGPPGPPPMQQPAYGYMQPGAYPGQPPQYNTSQPPYGSYPSQPASGGYSSGWDQSSNTPTQQTTPAAGYDYYNQQQPQQQQQAQQQTLGASSAPADATSYNYGQPPVYGSQGSYADASSYSTGQQQQQAYGQETYSGGYSSQQPQTGAQNAQAGYDQGYGYGATAVANPAQDGSAAATYGAPAQQGYSSQPPSTAPVYGQTAPLTQPGYGQSPQAQKPPAVQAGPPPTTQAAYVQPGYGQPPPVYAQAYGQQVPGYGGGAPASQAGYGQQQQPYADAYGSGGGYPQQPSAYSSEGGGTAPAVPKASPQS